MAPFESPNVIVSGFKEKAEALVVQGVYLEPALSCQDLSDNDFAGDRLYVGTSTGNLYVYSLDDSPSMYYYES